MQGIVGVNPQTSSYFHVIQGIYDLGRCDLVS
jgi:hypothetical protein